MAIKRSKRAPSRQAEYDWMEDLPSASNAPERGTGGAGRDAGYGAPRQGDREQGWHLLAEHGPDAGRRFPLGMQARLGRSSENDVHLADPQASRQHAMIQRIQGDWVITDLGSSNGTFLGERRLAEPTPLREGDRIRVGNTTLRLVTGSPTASPGRGAPSSPEPPATPATDRASFCPNCGQSLKAGARFCTACGTSMPGTGAPAAYQAAPAYSSAHSDQPVVGVISFVERRKGLLRKEAFNLVLTPDRLILARLTDEMLKAAVEQARQSAKAQGKGFFGQWGAQFGASRSMAERYYQMSVESILREHPDNTQILVDQVRKVQVKRGQFDETQSEPDRLVIHAGDKINLELKGTNAGEARKALRQVLGDRVK